MPTYRLIAAGVALLLYFTVAMVILAYMLNGKAAMDTALWQQVIVVFNAIGAIATTAAGVLLGVEIQHASTQQSVLKATEMSGQLEASKAAAAIALSHLETGDATTRDGVTAARTALIAALAPRQAA